MALGCATSWGERKGIAYYVALSKKYKNEIAIVMVGVNEKLKRALPPEIIAISRTENLRELVGLYAAADVVLNLSCEESFGMTTVEGLACGTPGIVFKSTASPELLTGETGFVVEQGDLDGVVSAIETMRSRGGKAAYAAACRSRALACFKKEDRWREYLSLYFRGE